MRDYSVTEIDQLEDSLRSVAQAVSSEIGDEFFESLVTRLAASLEVAYAFVGQPADSSFEQIRTIAVSAHGHIIDNFTYDLEGTPCVNVLNKTLCVYEDSVQAEFPRDELLTDLGIHSYAGLPLSDSDGHVVGLLVVLDTHPIRYSQLADVLLKVFGTRAAAELQRRQAYDQLESIVRSRTAELTRANEQLRREMQQRERAQDLAQEHQVQLAHVGRLSTMGEMTTQIAHELNQPLAAIINYAEAWLREMKNHQSPESGAECAQHIINQAERISGIIKRIRGFIQRGELKTGPVDINQIALDAINLADLDARVNRVGFRSQLQPNLPAAKGDSIQIEQVLLNLLRNAIEAIVECESPKRQVTISTAVADNGQIKMTVDDTGPGLSLNQTKVFEPFYTTKEDGLGMGLAIARSIVLGLDGTLDAGCNANGGARFTVRIPAYAPQEMR